MSQQPKESAVQAVLAALRELADVRTTRRLSGRRVADVVSPYDGETSLTRKISDKTGMAPGTAASCVSVLAKAGFFEPTVGGGRKRRWVALDGRFRYPRS